MQLEKVYEPQRHEPHWAQWWIENGFYHVAADQSSSRPVFSIVIPPPNVTGSLHLGHMLDHTIMDVAVRWHRMRGELTLWLPGTDHAGIATQMVVERALAAENLTRQAIGRAEFERRVWQWKQEYGGRINDQIRREGASVDWARERFTLDAGLSRAVREAFVRLWERGLLYRGEYVVTWCPRCQTAISDVETSHESVDGSLWHIRYPFVDSGGFITVATTRPETVLGDTALAVNPNDDRYRAFVGQSVHVPLTNRRISIVADEGVDPGFGTGVLKVTPAHDLNDFEMGKRHQLPSIKVIGEDGRMTEEATSYAGLDRFEARTRIVAALEDDGSLERIDNYVVNLSRCGRCNTIVEPLVSKQWFVRTKPLAEAAIDAVRTGRIRFVPGDREPVFFQWMENIRDWCISRQLWWGHRIPAWHCKPDGHITVEREMPAVCSVCRSTEIEQDPDVLDTWFSSGLWPFSTLGWPDETADLRTFYPTTLLITGFDILFFWVCRMVMLGLECTGDVPFREVHMHGLVRDADKQKMSKTKGNVVDPVVLMDQYGTDAVRVALLISAATGSDIALKPDRMEAARGFANKIWNASRLLFMNMERSKVEGWKPTLTSLDFESDALEDRWIAGRFAQSLRVVERALAVHRYHEAAQVLWDYFWGDFCDWYLEVKKQRFQPDSGLDKHWQAALSIYEASLRLLHPFMPFLTEELWQRLIHHDPAAAGFPRSISLAPFPSQPSKADAGDEFTILQDIVRAARELRADHNLDSRATLPASVRLHKNDLPADELQTIAALARLTWTAPSASNGRKPPTRSTPHFDLEIYASQPENRERIAKETQKLREVITRTEEQLANDEFVSKAPARVLIAMRDKLDGYREQLRKNELF